MIDNYLNTGLPKQAIPQSKKTDEWKQRCVDAVINISFSNRGFKRTNKEIKINYDLMNSIFNKNDYSHIMNPLGLEDEFYQGDPAELQNYNQLANKVHRLGGGVLKRPFDFQVVAIGGEAMSEKSRLKVQEVYNTTIEFLTNTNPDLNEEQFASLVESKVKNVDLSFQDISEIKCNKMLAYLRKDLDIDNKFYKGFMDGLISAFTIYRVSIINGKPHLRVVNPLYFDYDQSEENEYIQDGEWSKEERWLSVSSVVDEFGEYLKESDIKRLEEGNISAYSGFSDLFPKEYFFSGLSTRGYRYVRVFDVVWKSRKKVYFLNYKDELSGIETEEMVDETFKLTKALEKQGYTLEERWVNEIWQGTKIGSDIYVNIEPLPNQLFNLKHPERCKLPYIGVAYNKRNSIPTSIIDLLKPHQYLYNVIWYKLEGEIAKSIGKVTRFDLATLPRKEGISIETWIYYLTKLGISFFNSAEEGVNPNTIPGSIQEQDLGLSQAAITYISILNKIEDVMDDISGVPRQARGDVFASESVGNVNNSISQSSYVTEHMYQQHDMCKKEVYNQLLEISKLCFIDGGEIEFFTDDFERISLQLHPEELLLSDHAIFVSNSMEDMEIKNNLKALAELQIKSGQGSISDMIAIYRNGSIASISKEIKDNDKEKIQREQQQAEQQNQIAQQQIDIQKENTAWEKEKFYAELEAKYNVETSSTTEPKDNTNDLIKLEDIRSKERQTKIKADTALKVAKENKNKAELSKSKSKK